MYESLYTLSCLLHALSIYWAIKTFIIGEEYFVNSSPFSIFKSDIEKFFWTTVAGAFGNLCFLIAKPFYIMQFGGHTTQWQEPIWVTGHIAIGLSTAIWHYMTLGKIKGRVNEGKS